MVYWGIFDESFRSIFSHHSLNRSVFGVEDSDRTKCWNPIRLCGWDSFGPKLSQTSQPSCPLCLEDLNIVWWFRQHIQTRQHKVFNKKVSWNKYIIYWCESKVYEITSNANTSAGQNPKKTSNCFSDFRSVGLANHLSSPNHLPSWSASQRVPQLSNTETSDISTSSEGKNPTKSNLYWIEFLQHPLLFDYMFIQLTTYMKSFLVFQLEFHLRVAPNKDAQQIVSAPFLLRKHLDNMPQKQQRIKDVAKARHSTIKTSEFEQSSIFSCLLWMYRIYIGLEYCVLRKVDRTERRERC